MDYCDRDPSSQLACPCSRRRGSGRALLSKNASGAGGGKQVALPKKSCIMGLPMADSTGRCIDKSNLPVRDLDEEPSIASPNSTRVSKGDVWHAQIRAEEVSRIGRTVGRDSSDGHDVVSPGTLVLPVGLPTGTCQFESVIEPSRHAQLSIPVTTCRNQTWNLLQPRNFLRSEYGGLA